MEVQMILRQVRKYRNIEVDAIRTAELQAVRDTSIANLPHLPPPLCSSGDAA